MIPMSLGVVEGLSDAEVFAANKMLTTINQKSSGNEERVTYYLGHDALKDLGIAVPKFLTTTPTVVGWPAKAVESMASRSLFDGFVVPGVDGDPLELRKILLDNRFSILYSQAVRSQLVQSVVFWALTRDELGQVRISVRTAEMATGLYDQESQQLVAGLAVVAFGDGLADAATPTKLLLFLPDETVALDLRGGVWGVSGRQHHGIGRPAFVAMPYEASEARPFGRSRITRELMSLTDSAQRQALRLEVLMEFNAAPQKYLLGAEEDTFKGGNSKMSAYLSEIFAVSRDENGELPVFGQLPQISPQGAISYFNHLAARFSGASSVPLSSLGVVDDNPSSAEAMREAKDDLVTATQAMNIANGHALASVGRLTVCLRDGLSWDDLPEEARLLNAHFRNPALPSIVSQSDAMVKQISAIPWLADTEVALEELGYDDSQITRLLDAKRRAEGRSLVSTLLAAKQAPEEDESVVEVVSADVG